MVVLTAEVQKINSAVSSVTDHLTQMLKEGRGHKDTRTRWWQENWTGGTGQNEQF